MAIDITNSTVQAMGSIVGSWVGSAPWIRQPANDKTFYCNTGELGYLLAIAEMSGEFYGEAMGDGDLEAVGTLTASLIRGSIASGILLAAGIISADFYTQVPQSSWVAWSKIGEIGFTADRTNDAGRMPIYGTVYQVRAIGTKPGCCVIYGSDSIVMMYPVAEPMATFGFRIVSRTGIQSRYTAVGDKATHYYIDPRGDLHKLTLNAVNAPEDVNSGYREYLSVLGATTLMHYDPVNARVFICDGVTGYILSQQGLGGGPANLTSLKKDGTLTIYAAPTVYVDSCMHLCTDTLDFGVRVQKTLQKLEVATYTPGTIFYAIDYRSDVQSSFTTSEWLPLNSRGEGFVWKAGVDFRVRLKTLTALQLQIESIRLWVNISDRQVQ